MPSPFPGMDPYIEGPTHWSDFHSELIGAMRALLSQVLPENYAARIDEHVMAVTPVLREEADDPTYLPDVSVLRRDLIPSDEAAETATGSAGTMTLDHPTVTLQNIHFRDEHTELYLKIVRLPEMQVVAVIELLSPTNKYGEGRGLYMEKRREVLERPVHLIEIDLHRAGVSIEFDRPLPTGHYRCFVSRADRRPECDVYSWTVRERLPRIPVPLLPPDADVLLDLGVAFGEAFQRGRYDKFIKYDHPTPAPRFSTVDTEWIEQIVGLRNRRQE